MSSTAASPWAACLRKYVEQVFLTPTELLHNYKALKKFQDADTLYPSAVDRVATVQAKASGTDAKARRDELHKFAAQATVRVRKVEESGSLPDFKGTDFKAAYDRIKRTAPPDEASYLALVVLCRDLVQHRDWLAKLARIAELIQPEGDDEILQLFDRVMADLVATPSALQDILGQHRNLAAALGAIIELHDNGQAAEKSDARDEIAKIGPLIASGQMRETRLSLIERLCRQLGSPAPLSKNDPSKERDAIKEIVAKLFRADGILGGPDAAAAMTKRFVYLQEGGGLSALKNSVGGVVSTMKDMLDRVIYLLELAKSELGKDLRETISDQLSKLIEVNDLNSLAPGAQGRHRETFGGEAHLRDLEGRRFQRSARCRAAAAGGTARYVAGRVHQARRHHREARQSIGAAARSGDAPGGVLRFGNPARWPCPARGARTRGDASPSAQFRSCLHRGPNRPGQMRGASTRIPRPAGAGGI